jgi:hypothetical protein
LLIAFLGFGFRVSGRRERIDGLAEVHAATLGHGRFQSVEAAGDIKILRDVSGGDALADGLEAESTAIRACFARYSQQKRSDLVKSNA